MGTRVLLSLIAASFGWGLAGVGTRALFIDGTSTFTVIVTRTLVATAALVLVASTRRPRIDHEAWAHGFLIGIPRIALAPMFFIGSLQFVSAGFEGLVITIVPVATAGLAHLFLGERLHAQQATGLALGLVGTTVLVLSGESGIAGGGNTLIGGGLALLGVVFGSASGVLARKYAPHHDTMDLALPMFVSGALGVSLVGLLLGDVRPSTVPGWGWPVLLALGLGSTLLPFTATLYASRHTSAARVALTGYAAPLIGVVGGVVLLGEVVSAPLVAGGALTVAGVIMAGRGRVRVPRPAG